MCYNMVIHIWYDNFLIKLPVKTVHISWIVLSSFLSNGDALLAITNKILANMINLNIILFDLEKKTKISIIYTHLYINKKSS
jgi:hypothetical protein